MSLFHLVSVNIMVIITNIGPTFIFTIISIITGLSVIPLGSFSPLRVSRLEENENYYPAVASDDTNFTQNFIKIWPAVFN
jgi:hypothetical protein